MYLPLMSFANQLPGRCEPFGVAGGQAGATRAARGIAPVLRHCLALLVVGLAASSGLAEAADPGAPALAAPVAGDVQAVLPPAPVSAPEPANASDPAPAAPDPIAAPLPETPAAALPSARLAPVLPAAAPAPLIEITRAVWAAEVNRESKQPVSLLSRAVPGKPLVLWMSVQGSAAALEQLTARGKLPIRHKWFRETLVGIRPEGVALPVDEIEIPAAHPDLLAKLRQEVGMLGHFNWRTWSAKERPGRGSWRVTVVYADNTPVLCVGSGGVRPCEYVIEAR